ncbi:MAG: porin [Pirellulales bacterium]
MRSLVALTTAAARPVFRRRPSRRGLILLALSLATAHAEPALSQQPQLFAPQTFEAPALVEPASAEPTLLLEASPLPVTPNTGGFSDPPFAGVPTSYADTMAAPARSSDPIVADLQKRLADVEGQLKKRDDADKKAAAKKAAEEFPSHKITGFTQLDTGFFDQDARNIATVGDMQNGTGFRRARLAVTGKVREFTAYQLEVDFATAGRPSFFDCWVEQSNLPRFGAVKVGQFCQPFSIDSLTGFRNLTFLERSLPFLAMVPFRRVGVQSANLSEDEMTQWTYSVFRTGGFSNAPLGDDRFATDIGDVGGVSFSARATHLLQYDDQADDRYLWHVGAAYDYSLLGANDAIGSGAAGNTGSPRPFYQARTNPEFGTLGYPEFPSSFGPGGAANGTPSFVDSGATWRATSTCSVWKPSGNTARGVRKPSSWRRSSKAPSVRFSITAPTGNSPTV